MTKYLNTIKNFLDGQNVDYEVLRHEQSFTAMEIAGSMHVPGKNMVKSVIVTDGSQYLMCVLPAVHLVDFDRLENLSGWQNLRLANEDEIAKLYPDLEVGAEPPFGKWGDTNIDLYADDTLADSNYIVFNAGSHTESIKMSWSDYQQIANPQLVSFGVHV